MKQFAIIGLCLTLVGCGEYSDGDRTGTIQKFSRKGLFSKTWEGEMMLGGLVKKSSTSSDSDGNTHTTSSMVANVWQFTVEDPALIEQVKKAMEDGGGVRAHYRQEYLASPFRTETGVFGPYFLTKIAP